MIRKTLNSLAFAVGCAIALAAVPVQAQTADTQSRMGRNEANLQNRMQRECGSMANAHLRTGCMDSLALREDLRSRGLRDGLTGGGDGRMNPIDRTFQGPDKYDPHLGR
jgi:hypothetical protein